MKHRDWNKEDAKYPTKGKLPQGENINCFAQHTKFVKSMAGPTKYDNQKWDKFAKKVKLGFTSTVPYSGYIDDAVVRSKERPPATKYTAIRFELHKATSSSQKAFFGMKDRNCGTRMQTITKYKDPDLKPEIGLEFTRIKG